MIRWAVVLLAVVLAMACGGGGGPVSSVQLFGRVLQVETGGPPSPPASVQVGGTSLLTSLVDGSFSLSVPRGASALTVDSRSASGVWTFTFPPANSATDVGDLWIGPERITLTGVVRNSTNDAPIPNATVIFGGRSGVTNSSGVFNLAEVAYSSLTQTAFWGIAGTVRANGFFATNFSAQDRLAVAGVVDVGTILLTPTSDPNPPGTPFNIWGVVSPANQAQGTIATLRQGGVAVRIFNVGADGRYMFWVSPGTYTIDFEKGALGASVPPFTLNQPNEVIRRDVTLQ